MQATLREHLRSFQETERRTNGLWIALFAMDSLGGELTLRGGGGRGGGKGNSFAYKNGKSWLGTAIKKTRAMEIKKAVTHTTTQNEGEINKNYSVVGTTTKEL